MTDNRTNEPNQNETKSGQAFCFTEARVEAAVNAAWERQEFHRGPGGQVVEAPGPVFRHIIESALTAAGAAPQAESDERVQAWERLIKHPIWRSCFEEERPLIDSVMERIANLADLEMTVNELAPAPALPSSTVDEDALALIVEAEMLSDAAVSDEWSDFKVEKTAERIARAVAEWLKEQGR